MINLRKAALLDHTSAKNPGALYKTNSVAASPNSILICRTSSSTPEGDSNVSTTKPFGGLAAFTMIELLVVVSIIIVIASLLTPAISKMLESAARQKVATRCQAVILAIKKYKNLYQKWPGQTSQDDDGSIEQRFILPALLDNPRGQILLDMRPDWTNSNGELMDTWEQGCQIIMDENDDGIVQVLQASLVGAYPITTNIENATVVVISWGPKPATERKRIYSWRH